MQTAVSYPNDHRDFYEGAGLVYMQGGSFTPSIRAYLQAEGLFLKERLKGLKRVVEVGSGAGNNLVKLAPLVGELVGVDYAVQMVTQARAQTRNLSNVHVIRGNAEALSQHVGGRFDGAFLAWNTFGNMQDVQHRQILTELCKVVDGVMYFSVYRTGQPVLDARLAYYRHINFEVKAIEGEHITVWSGGTEMTAHAYPIAYYKRLMATCGLTMAIHFISDIGMIVEARGC